MGIQMLIMLILSILVIGGIVTAVYKYFTNNYQKK